MKYALALIPACLLLSGSAHAEHAMIVKVRDLNLHTQAGAAVALQRISDAAAAFCTAPTPRSLRQVGVREMDVTTLKCRRDLVDRAAIELGSPEVRYLSLQIGPTRMLADSGSSQLR
jgi:UrcA family protein